MAWETKPTRRAQRGRTGFTCGRKVTGVAALLTFSIGTGFGFRNSGPAFFGLEGCGSVTARFTVFASFPFRADEHRRVEAFLIVAVHSPSPRSRTTALGLPS